MTPPPSPLVSVCICAYNAASYIEAALMSIARQTYPNLEIVVVDDGSRDGTSDTVSRWGASDPRVRLVRSTENHGIAYARQTALEAATGEWVVFLDADDIAMPEMIEREIALVQGDPSLLAVSVGAILTGPDGPSQPIAVRRIGPTSKAHFKSLVDETKLVFMETPSLLPRQQALEVGGFRLFSSHRDGRVRMRDLAEDLDLWCRLSDLGRQGRFMVSLPEALVYIRKTAGSLSSANSGLMAMRIAWIKDCMRRRRQGLAELGYDDFERSLTGLQWLRFQRNAFGARQWRALGSAYMERRWASALWSLLLVLLVNPGRLVRGRARLQRTASLEDA